jgi:hypothetical protein
LFGRVWVVRPFSLPRNVRRNVPTWLVIINILPLMNSGRVSPFRCHHSGKPCCCCVLWCHHFLCRRHHLLWLSSHFCPLGTDDACTGLGKPFG